MNVSMYGPNHDHHHTAAGYLPTPANHHHQIGTAGYANFSSHLHHSHPHSPHYTHTNASHYNLSDHQTSSASVSNAITPPAINNAAPPSTSLATAIPPPSSTSSGGSANVHHQIYHPHLYSPTAVEYGITTANATPPDDVYYDADPVASSGHPPFYQHQSGSGCATPSSAMIHDHIINTDNGLSYTNLDYMNYSSGTTSGYLSGGDDKMSATNPYGHSSAAESPISYNHHHHHQHHLHHSAHHQSHHTGALLHHPNHHPSISNNSAAGASAWHMTQPVADYLDTSQATSAIAQHLGLGSLTGGMHLDTSQQQQHTMRGATPSTGHIGRSGNHQSISHHQHQSSVHQLHHGQPAPQSPVDMQPTYKWMQVKRNVPKPHSK